MTILELNDQEYACAIMRGCGVLNIAAALGRDHSLDCRFCTGKMEIT